MSTASVPSPRAVVIGASGFIGTRLVRRLTEQGVVIEYGLQVDIPS